MEGAHTQYGHNGWGVTPWSLNNNGRLRLLPSNEKPTGHRGNIHVQWIGKCCGHVLASRGAKAQVRNGAMGGNGESSHDGRTAGICLRFWCMVWWRDGGPRASLTHPPSRQILYMPGVLTSAQNLVNGLRETFKPSRESSSIQRPFGHSLVELGFEGWRWGDHLSPTLSTRHITEPSVTECTATHSNTITVT